MARTSAPPPAAPPPPPPQSLPLGMIGGDDFIPDEGGGVRRTPTTTIDRLNAPAFQYAFNPWRWTIMEGRIVPCLHKIRAIGGLNGVSEDVDRNGVATLRTGAARSDAEDRGRKLIPYTKTQDGRSYLYRPEGRPDVTLSRWERVFSGTATVVCDKAGYVAWLEWLMSPGSDGDGRAFLPGPTLDVLQRMRSQLSTQRDELMNLAHKNPSYAKRAAQAGEQLATVEARIAQVSAGTIMLGGGDFVPEGEV